MIFKRAYINLFGSLISGDYAGNLVRRKRMVFLEPSQVSELQIKTKILFWSL